jgi:DNA-binding GntR family transcriptional regulator
VVGLSKALVDERGRALASAAVPAVTRKDAVLLTLRRAIIEGTLAPGVRLDSGDIAARLGCSRMPVRDALKELEAEGLVTCYPSRGTEVSRLDRHDIEQLFGIRLALESLAIRRAAEGLTEADFEVLRATLLEMDATDDLGRWLTLNEAFHARLNAASGWPRLVEQIERLRRNIERYVRARIRFDGRAGPQAQHWALYEACRARDAERACAILSDHLSRTARTLCGEEGAPAASSLEVDDGQGRTP